MFELLEGARSGNLRAIARLITAIENDPLQAQMAVEELYPATGGAHIVGITGPPGCGKSSLVNELALGLHDKGHKIGIVAVDPSSPFTGGALLGDRVRMIDIVARPGIFMRSMATRGTLGGLAEATSAVIKVLDAAGYDVILVETVGAGQVEVDIASVAHTVLVVEAPGSGDEVQSIKAGILEIADILVVNKADRPSALNTVRTLESMLQQSRTTHAGHHGHNLSESMASDRQERTTEGWDVRVLPTVAIEKQGIDELLGRIEEHRRYLLASGGWFEREKSRSRREINALLDRLAMRRLKREIAPEREEAYITAVAERRLDPYTAAERLFSLANQE